MGKKYYSEEIEKDTRYRQEYAEGIADFLNREKEKAETRRYEDCPWREQALYALDSRNQNHTIEEDCGLASPAIFERPNTWVNGESNLFVNTYAFIKEFLV